MATSKKTASSKESASKSGASAKSTAKSSAKSAKGEKSVKASKSADAGAAGKGDEKRKLGVRGAAPWAARHAAKHAAEARARAAEPPLPGSARATIRVPQGADDIKQKIGELHTALANIKAKASKKHLEKNFYEVGEMLRDVQARKLYVAKGYGTFEAFLEREVEFGKTTGIRLVRIVTTFLKSAAHEYGFDRLVGVLAQLDASMETLTNGKEAPRVPPAPLSSSSLPLKPPGRI
jgi:hypothetical protein